MFKSKLLAAFVLSVALMPLNSIAMGEPEQEGQPGVAFVRGGVQPAAQDGAAAAQPALQQPVRQLAPAAGGAPAPAPAPAAQLSSWSRLGRQLIKPLAFVLGAAACGGITYLGSKNLSEENRALWSTLAGWIGGVTGMSYTKQEKDYKYVPPRVVRQGSLAASVGFAGTVAGLGIAAAKISNGSFSGGSWAYLAGLAVGHAMYYAD